MANSEKTEITVKDITKVIKLSTFLEIYCNTNARGGIYHRINGYGTNKTSKIKGLSKEDEVLIKEGLIKLQLEIDTVIKGLAKEEDDKIQS